MRALLLCSLCVVLVCCGRKAPALEQELCALRRFESPAADVELLLECGRTYVLRKNDVVISQGAWSVLHSDRGNYVEMIESGSQAPYQFTWNARCIHFDYPGMDWGSPDFCAASD